MKRSQMYKKINRKNIFNHVNRNVVYPTILCNTNINDVERNNSVEIIELNSDDAPDQQTSLDTSHEWCTIGESYPDSDECTLNRTTRHNRRESNKNQFHENLGNSNKIHEDVLNQIFTDFYGIDCHDRGERLLTSNKSPSEFITILNNHITSDTSSDSNYYDDFEVIQCDNTNQNDYWNANFSQDDAVYVNEDKPEKRTIWIYALKNQRFLSENDLELTNIPSKESSTTTEEDEANEDIPKIRRIATPIPSYIPRLNLPLSPTLPTVKEVSEPNKQTPNDSEISQPNTANKLFQKPINSWLENESNKLHNHEHCTDRDLKNNWKTPRERRRLTHATINEFESPTIKKVVASDEYCEPTVIIHTHEASPELNTKNNEKLSYAEKIEECDRVLSINETKTDENLKNGNNSACEGSFNGCQKPRITLNTKTKIRKEDITDPIEKLEGQWIGNDVEILEVYDYGVEDNTQATQKITEVLDECAGDRLFIRNMSLMKPAEWTQYLPVTGSMPSLHLSISLDTDFDSEKKSWLKRFMKFVHCCK